MPRVPLREVGLWTKELSRLYKYPLYNASGLSWWPDEIEAESLVLSGRAVWDQHSDGSPCLRATGHEPLPNCRDFPTPQAITAREMQINAGVGSFNGVEVTREEEAYVRDKVMAWQDHRRPMIATVVLEKA